MARPGLNSLMPDAGLPRMDEYNDDLSLQQFDPWDRIRSDPRVKKMQALGIDLPGIPDKPRKPKRSRRSTPYSSQQDLQQSASGLAEAGLGTLVGAANIIDLPASFSREMWWNVGQLAKPTDPAKPFAHMANPFDQFLPWNWTTQEGRKEHRDTFRHFGLAKEEDTWYNFWPDFALDIVTDPLTYVTLGASTAPKIGAQIARKAGVFGKLSNKVSSRLGKGIKAGPRVTMRHGRLKDVYKPLMADESFDFVKARKISDKIDAKKKYLADEFGEGTDEYAEALDRFRLELDADQRMLSERADEILDAANIENAAGFAKKRKELLKKYGPDSDEYKQALSEFQKDLINRMEEGDLSGPLGGMFGVVNPLTGRGLNIDDYIRGSDWMAKKADDLGAYISNSIPARFVKQHVHAPAMGLFRKGAQALAERVYPAKRTAEAQARMLATVGPKSPANLLAKAASITEDIVGEKLAAAADAKGKKMTEVGPNQKKAFNNFIKSTKAAGIDDEGAHVVWATIRANKMMMAQEKSLPLDDLWGDLEFRAPSSAPSPNAPPRVGQAVQWAPGGKNAFEESVPVEGVSGGYVFVGPYKPSKDVPLRPGDKVQWTTGGQDMFPEPIPVNRVEQGYAFVEPYELPDGTLVRGATGIPLDEIRVVREAGIPLSEIRTPDELFQVYEGRRSGKGRFVAEDMDFGEYASRVERYVDNALGDNDLVDWKAWQKRMGKLGASNLELDDAGIDEAWFKEAGDSSGKVTKQQLSNRIQEKAPSILFENTGQWKEHTPTTFGGITWGEFAATDSYESVIAQYLDPASAQEFSVKQAASLEARDKFRKMYPDKPMSDFFVQGDESTLSGLVHTSYQDARASFDDLAGRKHAVLDYLDKSGKSGDDLFKYLDTIIGDVIEVQGGTKEFTGEAGALRTALAKYDEDLSTLRQLQVLSGVHRRDLRHLRERVADHTSLGSLDPRYMQRSVTGLAEEYDRAVKSRQEFFGEVEDRYWELVNSPLDDFSGAEAEALSKFINDLDHRLPSLPNSTSLISHADHTYALISHINSGKKLSANMREWRNKHGSREWDNKAIPLDPDSEAGKLFATAHDVPSIKAGEFAESPLELKVMAQGHYLGSPLFHLRREAVRDGDKLGSVLYEAQSDLIQGIKKSERGYKLLRDSVDDIVNEKISPAEFVDDLGRKRTEIDGPEMEMLEALQALQTTRKKLLNNPTWLNDKVATAAHMNAITNLFKRKAKGLSTIRFNREALAEGYAPYSKEWLSTWSDPDLGDFDKIQALLTKYRHPQIVSRYLNRSSPDLTASPFRERALKDLVGIMDKEIAHVKKSLKKWAKDPKGYYADGSKSYGNWDPEAAFTRMQGIESKTTHSHAPFSAEVPYTGSWEKLAINEHLRRAIDEGADFIALPDPEDIARGVAAGDDEMAREGIKFFYGNKMKKLWEKRLKQLDPSFKPPEWLGSRIGTDHHYVNYTRLDITPEMKRRFESEGIPLYMKDKGKVLGSFSVEDGKKIVSLFEGSNFNTLVHETGHLFRRTLGEASQDLLARAEKQYGVTGGNWSRKQEESFAKDFQVYVKEGKFANRDIRSVFRKFKDWLSNIYSGLVGGPGGRKISKEMRELFDEMLGEGAGGIAKVNDLQDAADISGSILHHVQERLEKVGLGDAFDEATARLLPDSVTAEQKARLFKELGPVAEELAGVMKEANELQYNSMYARGVPSGYVDTSKVSYATRTGAGKEVADESLGGGRVAPVRGLATESRDDEIMEIPELIVTQMLLDPEIVANKKSVEGITRVIKDEYSEWLSETYEQGTKKERADRFAKWVKRNHGKKWFPDQIQKWKTLLDPNGQKAIDDLLATISRGVEAGSIDNELLERLDGVIKLQRIDNHATNLAKWLQLEAGKRVHGYDRLSNFIRYQSSATRLSLVSEGMHRHVLENMVMASESVDDNVMSVAEAYKKAGLVENRAVDYLSEISGIDAEDLAKNYVVSSDVAKSLSEVMKAHKPGEWQNNLIGAIDRLNSYFKASVTVLAPKGVPLFPAFFERNHVSGMFVNLTSGHVPLASLGDYANATRKAWAIQDQPNSDYIVEALTYGIIGHGKGFEGAQMLEGGVPPKLTEYLKAMVPGIGKKERAALLERVNKLADAINEDPSMLAKAFIEPKRGSKELLGRTEKYIGHALDKSGSITARAANKVRDEFAQATAWGGMLNSIVEYNNRMPMYIYLRDQGWSAKAAAEEVMKLHFDYSDLAPTERHLLKKVFPFYTFSRKAAELFANTLMSRPGGAMAKSVKLSGRLSEDDAFTPQYVSKQTHVPLHGVLPAGIAAPEGHRAYLTGFGLPYEDTISMLPITSFREAGGNILSRLNPAAAGALELASGRSLFRDQPLPETHRKVSQIASNVATGINAIAGEGTVPVPSNRALPYVPEHIIAKSPFARILTSVSTLTDPRKSALVKASQFVTPFRITTVSPEAQRRAIKDRGTERLKDMGVARETAYTPSYALEALPPLEREEALRINALMRATRTQRYAP